MAELDEAAALARLLTQHATTPAAPGLDAVVEALRTALADRQVIGEAMGILMERHRFSSPRAYETLAAMSQNLDVGMPDLAAYVVRTRQDPMTITRGELSDQRAW